MALQKIAALNELPEGEGKVVNVSGEEIALFKVDEKVYAIENACCHQGGPLGEGTVEGTVVTCPWHNWKFDVTTGKSPIVPDASVRTFVTKVDGDDVLIDS